MHSALSVEGLVPLTKLLKNILDFSHFVLPLRGQNGSNRVLPDKCNVFLPVFKTPTFRGTGGLLLLALTAHKTTDMRNIRILIL